MPHLRIQIAERRIKSEVLGMQSRADMDSSKWGHRREICRPLFIKTSMRAIWQAFWAPLEWFSAAPCPAAELSRGFKEFGLDNINWLHVLPARKYGQFIVQYLMGQSEYFLTFSEDYSWRTCAYFLKRKYYVYQSVYDFVQLFKHHSGKYVMHLCWVTGILSFQGRRRLSTPSLIGFEKIEPCTWQQNNIADRTITLM